MDVQVIIITKIYIGEHISICILNTFLFPPIAQEFFFVMYFNMLLYNNMSITIFFPGWQRQMTLKSPCIRAHINKQANFAVKTSLYYDWLIIKNMTGFPYSYQNEQHNV